MTYNVHATPESTKPYLSLGQRKALFALSSGGMIATLLGTVSHFSKIKIPTSVIALSGINTAAMAGASVYYANEQGTPYENNERPIHKAIENGLSATNFMLCFVVGSILNNQTASRISNIAVIGGYLSTVLTLTTASYYLKKWFPKLRL